MRAERLFVIFTPGLTLNVLDRAPTFRAVASCVLAIVPVEPVNETSHEVTCLTGLLPEYHGVMTRGSLPEKLAFWTRAQARRKFSVAACPLDVIEGCEAELVISQAPMMQAAPRLEALRKLAALCIIGTPADARCLTEPRERPVLIGCGFMHEKALLGACEVAGMLDRVITGVEVADKK
jgi:hypothetical protein